MMLPAVAVLVGLVLGNPGTRTQISEMGNFAATRPVTSAGLARGSLKITAASVLAGWLVWFVPFVILRGVLYSSGHVSQSISVAELWPTALGILAGAWTLASLSAAVQLTGRTIWFAIGFVGVAFGWILLVNSVAMALPSEVGRSIAMMFGVAVPLTFVGGVCWAFWQAWRCQLAQPSVLVAAIALGAAGVAAAFSTSTLDPARLDLGTAVFLSGWSLLAVVPVATFPLALAWNRVR